MATNITFKQTSTGRLTTSKSYDNLNRLTRTAAGPSVGAAVSFDYAYNDANQRVAVTNADGSRWIYQYDALGQVVRGRKPMVRGSPCRQKKSWQIQGADPCFVSRS